MIYITSSKTCTSDVILWMSIVVLIIQILLNSVMCEKYPWTNYKKDDDRNSTFHMNRSSVFLSKKS